MVPIGDAGEAWIGLDTSGSCNSAASCASVATWRGVSPTAPFSVPVGHSYSSYLVNAGLQYKVKEGGSLLAISQDLTASVVCEYNCDHLCPAATGTGPGNPGKATNLPLISEFHLGPFQLTVPPPIRLPSMGAHTAAV